jgi:hypothetical protein
MSKTIEREAGQSANRFVVNGSTLIDVLLVGAILLLPAAEWFSIAGIETGLASPTRITGAIGLAIVLCPLTLGAVVLQRRRVLGPVPLLVIALAIWVGVANLARPSFEVDSARTSVYFGLVSLTAFFATYVAAVTRSAQFARWIAALLTFMVVASVATAWLERFSLVATPEGVTERFEPLWSFVRPSIVNVSPVLGPVEVIVRHSLITETTLRPAGLFATPNAFADFLAIGFPVLAIISLASVPKRSPIVLVLFVLFMPALIQAAAWTGSRIGLATLGLELLAVPLLLTRVSGWSRRAALVVGAMLVASLILLVAVDPNVRARFTPAGLSLPGLSISESERRTTEVTATTTRGHVEIQLAAVRMILADPQAVLRGPGKFEFVRAIHDPTSPQYLGGLIGVGEGGPHSALLSFGIAGGLPAMLLFAAIAILTLLRSSEPAKNKRHDGSAVMLTGLTLGFAGWLLIGLVDTDPTLFPEAMAIFALIGAVNGLSDARLLSHGPRSAERPLAEPLA